MVFRGAVVLFVFAGLATALKLPPSNKTANSTFDWETWAPSHQRRAAADYGHPTWLATCDKIYLDVGSNKGVQVRKLFEQEKYKGAEANTWFDKFYGDVTQRPGTVCALGMEPNPLHRARLQALETAYNKRGFRTHFYPFAAYTEDGKMKFTNHPEDGEHADWGAHLRVGQEVEVRTVDLVDFVFSLPHGKVQVMKMDIEGAEWGILEKALPANMFCQNMVAHLMFEPHGDWVWTKHGWSAQNIWNKFVGPISEQKCPGSTFTEVTGDDESYLQDVDDDFA